MGVTTGRYGAHSRVNRVQNSQTVMGRTPVNVHTMVPWLDLYPNRDEAEELRLGFLFGFVIPYEFSDVLVLSENLRSVRENPEVHFKRFRLKLILERLNLCTWNCPFII